VSGRLGCLVLCFVFFLSCLVLCFVFLVSRPLFAGRSMGEFLVKRKKNIFRGRLQKQVSTEQPQPIFATRFAMVLECSAVFLGGQGHAPAIKKTFPNNRDWAVTKKRRATNVRLVE